MPLNKLNGTECDFDYLQLSWLGTINQLLLPLSFCWLKALWFTFVGGIFFLSHACEQGDEDLNQAV